MYHSCITSCACAGSNVTVKDISPSAGTTAEGGSRMKGRGW